MSPEELAEIRSTLEFAETNGADEEFLDTAYNLLAHIDSQAAQIKQHEGTIDLLQTELFELRKGKDAHEAISDLMAQISLLKEKLVEERASHIVAYDEDEWDLGKLPEIDVKEYMGEARQQLKAEMPGVEWEC